MSRQCPQNVAAETSRQNATSQQTQRCTNNSRRSLFTSCAATQSIEGAHAPSHALSPAVASNSRTQLDNSDCVAQSVQNAQDVDFQNIHNVEELNISTPIQRHRRWQNDCIGGTHPVTQNSIEQNECVSPSPQRFVLPISNHQIRSQSQPQSHYDPEAVGTYYYPNSDLIRNIGVGSFQSHCPACCSDRQQFTSSDPHEVSPESLNQNMSLHNNISSQNASPQLAGFPTIPNGSNGQPHAELIPNNTDMTNQFVNVGYTSIENLRYSDFRNRLKEHMEDERHINDQDEDMGTPVCKTCAIIETLSFQWDVSGFDAIRKMAGLKALPCKDRLVSRQFGNSRAGLWHLALFPYAERNTRRHVSVYLFSDDQQRRRVAEFRLVLLDQDGAEIPDTALNEKPCVFTPDGTGSATDSSSWGWHEFLSVPTEESLRSYLSKDGKDTLSVKASVCVYAGVEEVIGTRPLMDVFYGVYNHDIRNAKKDDIECPYGKDQETNSRPVETIHYSRPHEPLPYSAQRLKEPSFLTHLLRTNPTTLRRYMATTISSSGTRLSSYSLNPIKVTTGWGALDLKKRIQHLRSEIPSETTTDVPSESSLSSGSSSSPKTNLGVAIDQKREELDEENGRLGCSSETGSANIIPFIPPAFFSSSVSRDIQRLLNSFAGARDVTLICSHGERVAASSLILASRSPVFQIIIYGNFRQSDRREYIQVSSAKSVVQSFVEFLETDRCGLIEEIASISSAVVPIKNVPDVPIRNVGGLQFQGLLHLLWLWEMADFYMVPDLYCACVKALVRILSTKTATMIRSVAERLQCGALIEATKYLISRNTTLQQLTATI